MGKDRDIKSRFWYLLACSDSKGTQWNLLLYLLGYQAEKHMTGDTTLF